MTQNPVRRTRLGRVLSPSRLALLELIEGQPDPITLADLVKHCGLHENTVRGHLEQLLRDGYLIRTPGPSAGRGRPAWLWSAPLPEEPSPSADYAQLAAVLAKTITDTSPDPVATAQRAGQQGGATLAQSRAPTVPGADVSQTLVNLLEDLGFAPRPAADPAQIELHRCPLLAAANEFPEVVCNVHLGILQGAARELGADTEGSELIPFSAPGVCSLHLRVTPFAQLPPTAKLLAIQPVSKDNS